MLRAVRTLLVGLNILNWLCATGFAVLTIILMWPGTAIAARLARKFGDAAPLLVQSGIAVMLIGIAVAVAAHLLFTRLVAIIDTVAAGAPFVLSNAIRLGHIAWALLAIQVADTAYGVIAVRTSAATGEYFGWSPSIGGWLSVLLVFVLARVFRQGAAMQAEIEATI